MSEILSKMADEIDIHQVIDALEEDNGFFNESESENKPNRVYYISSSPDNHREAAHIHSILKRKNRTYKTHYPFQRNLDMNLSQGQNFIIDNNTCKQLTVIFLWSSLYEENEQCLDELDNFNKINQECLIDIKIVFLLLNPNIDIPEELSQGCLCLPGFDRVSRELAIFKLVEEENLMNEN
ncbi:hypothetical protein MHK_010632 [Candidatus Magnetomorum sp. HK-1]|nr:hypothetical protein MHK_010632 [Candidatus Magnetomorum sp. HK-1]